MLDDYRSLKFYEMVKPTSVVDSDYTSNELNLDTPAISVMKDYRREQAETIQTGTSINIAKRRMAKIDVPMLYVVDRDFELVGVLTSRDLSGEKTVTFMQLEGCTIDDVKVENIMTKKEELHALFVQDVLASRIGDVLQTMHNIGSGFVLVTMLENDMPAIRGMISAHYIAKKLGVFFDPMHSAKNFAELAQALKAS